MKYLALFLCLLALSGCSLTGKPSEPVISSGSIASGVLATGQVSTGENKILSGSTEISTGENKILSGSTEISTGETKLITNDEGDILFQELPKNEFFEEGVGFGPVYKRDSDGGMRFIPDFLPQKTQKLELSKDVSLYIKTYSKCEKNTDSCFTYSANIGYTTIDGEKFTTSIAGELIPYPGMINSRISDYTISSDDMYVTMPDGNGEKILIFDYNSKKTTTNKEILQKLTQKESHRNNNKSCFITITKKDLIIELYKAKTKCGEYMISGDEFEKAIYQRNPEIDTFTFIKAEPITNQ